MSCFFFFSCFSLWWTPATCSNWSVTGQCFRHPWWERGRQSNCKNSSSPFCNSGMNCSTGSRLVWAMSTARVCHRGWGAHRVFYWHFYPLFRIGRVINGEGYINFCWKYFVFILWADSGSQFGILWPQGPKKWYQISHFMISLHYVYVYINIFVCLYSI